MSFTLGWIAGSATAIALLLVPIMLIGASIDNTLQDISQTLEEIEGGEEK